MHGKEFNCRRARRPWLAARPGRSAVARTAALATTLLAAAAVTPAAQAAPAALPGRAGHPVQARTERPARPAPRTSDAAAAGANQRWTHIAIGWYSTCGIREGNTLWCWGYGQFGALGDEHKSPAALPQQVAPPTAGWNSVTAGLSDGCATRNDGSLWCWGKNFE